MKKLVASITIFLFLISFITAASITSRAIENNSKGNDGSMIQSNTQNTGDETELEIQNRIQENAGSKLTAEQIRNIFTIRNRLKIAANKAECPEKCTCTGDMTRCQLNNGAREMTIVAGNSGNMIMQVGGTDASTNVMLYKSENGKLYGDFGNSETKAINLLPDQVRERIRERLEMQLQNENITLNEDGTYRYEARKRARLFFLFPVEETVEAELDPETGKIIQIRNSWWGFLASDNEEQIIGASCGTVTPGQNDACCQNKGYDFWNEETGGCEFNVE